MHFSFLHREKRDITFPPQLIRLKSTIRKVRKEIRRLRRLQLPVGEMYGKLWRLRKQLKNFISKRYERKMMAISEQLNKWGGGGRGLFSIFYDYIKNKKTPPQQNMLLRAQDGHPLIEDDEIQDALFVQIDNIFKDYPWPLAGDVQLLENVKFSPEAIEYMDQPIMMEEIHM